MVDGFGQGRANGFAVPVPLARPGGTPDFPIVRVGGGCEGALAAR